MKKLKKLFAVMLSLIMVLAMGITSFAAAPGTDGKYGTADDTGIITVKGIENESGISVVAYPIITAQYGDSGSFSGYQSKYDVTGINTTDGINSDITLTAEQLTEYANQVTGQNYPMTRNATNGDYTAEVPVGAYLVLVTGTEAHSYNPMVVSVYYINKNGSTNLNEGELNLKETPATAKMSDAPTVDKIIANNPKDANGNDKGHSVNIGDTVEYKVSVASIPNYSGSYPVLNVVDTLSAGLTLNENSVAVTIGNTTLGKGTDYTVSFDKDNNKLKVDFVVNGAYKLNAYQGQTAYITYSATLNENAALNDAGNDNTVVLNYTTDSKTTGHGKPTDESKTYTYTFDIDGQATGTTGIITKTGEVKADGTKTLPGAVFALYHTRGDAEAARNEIATATSDDGGQIHFTGLKADTYYLKELTAPSGYSVNTNIYKVEITATYNNNGTLASWGVKVDDTDVASFTANSEGRWTNNIEKGAEIKNTKISSLPSTGGIGTTIFTIVGCGIMIAAAGLFFASRRKENR